MPTWKAGNTGINWQPTLKRTDGSVINLTSKTVKLQTENVDTGTELEVAGTLIDAVNGVCSFLIDTVIATAANYNAEIEIGASGYKEDSFTFSWIVLSQVKT